MKLLFMKQDAVDFLKHNMDRLYTHYYHDKDNLWIEQEYGNNPFEDLVEVSNFELTEIGSRSIGEVDFENCKILYNNLKMLSESQCSDERLWAGLCNGNFYNYMRNRYGYNKNQLKNKKDDISAIISRFFFSGGSRSGIFRNGLSKCWWVGRATYDRKKDNHFEMLDSIGANDLTTKISDIFYSNNFSSNPEILEGICDSLKYFKDRGIKLDEKKHVRASMKYLNAVGGAKLLDVLSKDEIRELITSKIISIINGKDDEIIYQNDDDDQLFNEIEYDEELIESFEDSDPISNSVTENTPNDEQDLILTKDDEIDDIENTLRIDYITYGCWVKLLRLRDNKVIKINIPLKDDDSVQWFALYDKLLGEHIDSKVYAGVHGYYLVIDFGLNN